MIERRPVGRRFFLVLIQCQVRSQTHALDKLAQDYQAQPERLPAWRPVAGSPQVAAEPGQGIKDISPGEQGPLALAAQHPQVAGRQPGLLGGCVRLPASALAHLDQGQGHNAEQGHGREQARRRLQLQALGA